MVLISVLSVGKAEPKYTNDKIADAIYKAENSTKFPYGIVSIDTHGDEVYARKICLNTIRNQRRRHKAHECGLTYLACLAKRYCPIGAENDNGTNQYWLKNVKWFLEKEA